MKRDSALALSDALAEAGFSHEISVGVTPDYRPRERYYVNVRCNLTMSANEIDKLRDIAYAHKLRLAFVQPSFTFDESGTA